MTEIKLSHLLDDNNQIHNVNHIFSDNFNSLGDKKLKKNKKLDFVENLVKNTISTNVHFNRSNIYLAKKKFHQSTNYNRYRKSYVDKLKKFQRSKSLACISDSRLLKLDDDGKISL